MSDYSRESEFGLFPEGTNECRPALGATECSAGFAGQVHQVLRAEVGQGMAFQMPPDVFGRVEFGSVSRQPGQVQAITDRSDEVLDLTAAVCRQAVPDDQQLAPDLAQEPAEEIDDLRRLDRPTIEPEVELPPRDSGDHRQFPPVEVKRQLRRLPAGRPRSAYRGLFTQSAFINKHEGSAFVPGLFFSAGHVYRFHRAIASSSRSCAFPQGRWQLQPNRPKTRHRWAG